MKSEKVLTFLLFTFSILPFTSSAAVPLRWTVETSRAVPAQFEAYQGETLALEAALQSYGKPLEAPINYSLYWQTNGMGNAWWSIPCIRTFEHSEHSNILYATWSPTNDVGAKVYNCFIGKPGTIYHAAFKLRLRPSPGATPNELPLPQKVIDFAKVTVLNPPWSGGGGGVDTNAVLGLIAPATNRLYKTLTDAMPDGAARPLPRYLHALDFSDTYPLDAAWYYDQPQDYGSCSAVRDGGFLYRNYDWKFDDAAEFVVRMSAADGRFASVGVANVGTNLTEDVVTSGKWSRYYKCLPGRVVDGINENGVVCSVNVVDGEPHDHWPMNGTIHCLGAVRWVLDNATNAASAACRLAAEVYFPSGFGQNFHWMVADETSTYIVENGEAHEVTGRAVMTNFKLYPTRDTSGEGQERFNLLMAGANITNAWYTNAYRRETNPPWVSDLSEVIAYTNEIFDAWATHPKEYFRGKTNNGIPWWQTVHTSVYDITNRTLRIAAQEVDDWYTFAVPSAGGVKPEAVREIVSPMIGAATNGLRRVDDMAVYEVVRTENTDWTWTSPDDDYYLLNFLRGKKITFNGTEWGYPDLPTGYSDDITPSGSPDDLSVSFQIHRLSDDFYVDVTATRPRYMDETLGPAKQNQQLAAVATDNASKPEDGSIMKYDAANDRFVKAEKSSTSSDPANADYRDPHDNTCHKTELGEWVAHGVPDGVTFVGHPQPEMHPPWLWWDDDGTGWNADSIDPDAVELTFTDSVREFTAIRSAVCTDGKKFVTSDVVDGKVSAVVSTNNPAFVSAVRNTPTENMPEDMPTDWGTYGTVGAALAALAAFVKWAKAKIVAVIGDDGRPTDDFATDLLGKQVAKVKANTVSLAAAYSETATYAVGDAVTHDGKLYKCKTAITTAEAWTPAHWTETTVATLWNNADTTSYGGQN